MSADERALTEAVRVARGLTASRRGELRTGPLPKSVRERKRHGDELALLDHADSGLSVIDAHGVALAQLGRERAAGLLVQLSAGRRGEARRLYLAGAASLEERLAASDASTEGTFVRTEAREKAADEVLDGLAELGLLALRAAVPFLLAGLAGL